MAIPPRSLRGPQGANRSRSDTAPGRTWPRASSQGRPARRRAASGSPARTSPRRGSCATSGGERRSGRLPRWSAAHGRRSPRGHRRCRRHWRPRATRGARHATTRQSPAGPRRPRASSIGRSAPSARWRFRSSVVRIRVGNYGLGSGITGKWTLLWGSCSSVSPGSRRPCSCPCRARCQWMGSRAPSSRTCPARPGSPRAGPGRPS